jgi:hypothetical protein
MCVPPLHAIVQYLCDYTQRKACQTSLEGYHTGLFKSQVVVRGLCKKMGQLIQLPRHP